jgi:hypothetical protein
VAVVEATPAKEVKPKKPRRAPAATGAPRRKPAAKKAVKAAVSNPEDEPAGDNGEG